MFQVIRVTVVKFIFIVKFNVNSIWVDTIYVLSNFYWEIQGWLFKTNNIVS